MHNADTIISLATPAEESALGLIRISGPLSISLCEEIFRLNSPTPRKSILKYYKDNENNIIDHVIFVYYANGNSFTGEDMVEISFHGNMIIANQILDDLISRNCRLAEPGEYSKRAFLNGKFDLTQAEAIAELISSKSEAEIEIAKQKLNGRLKKDLTTQRNKILQLHDKLEGIKKFTYSPNPEVLTGEIETLTNYNQRKRNLELRKKMFQDKEDEQSVKELERLEQLYTLGGVNFDSVIIIDFGNNLKSVLTSLVYTDVSQTDVLFTTINQWFDESIFYENTIKNLYYPSVNYKEFKKYNNKYFKKFKIFPNEITILAYDALGLIYYAWKKNGEIKSINDFAFKNKIKGKIGTFSFKNGKVIQELDIYKTENKKFVKF